MSTLCFTSQFKYMTFLYIVHHSIFLIPFNSEEFNRIINPWQTLNGFVSVIQRLNSQKEPLSHILGLAVNLLPSILVFRTSPKGPPTQ